MGGVSSQIFHFSLKYFLKYSLKIHRLAREGILNGS